jgi:tetratricopeptide (TPR) repeat protein
MATKPAMDDLTTGAIRRALAAASAGRLADARTLGEQALAQGGDVAALNAMLGMLYSRSGDLDGAVRHLRVARAERPRDPVIASNLANTLVQLDRKPEALEILTDEVIESDRTGQLLKLRAFLAQMTDDFDLAIRCYEQVVARDPGDLESWNNLGNAYSAADHVEQSIEALRRAASLDPQAAPIRLNLATALVTGGDWDGAEAELRAMTADFPDDPNPWRELHGLLKRSGRDGEAVDAIEEALNRAPDDRELLLGFAAHLSYIQRAKEAEATYRRVLELEPDNSLAHLGLALIFDVNNRTDELAAIVPQAEERGVGPQALNFMRALDHRRAKRFAEGLAAMEHVPGDLESARRAHLMGQLLEGAGRYDDAMESYAQMNAFLSQDIPQGEMRGATYREAVRARRDSLSQEWLDRWRQESEPDPRPSPVFLVGFPRSGTTLLDTMLMGHPSIEVLEEEPTLHEAFRTISHDALPTATDEQIRAARDGYFATAASLTPLRDGNLLIDKNPLGMNALPYIHRLFPNARIILALRHPCDSVLSCYVTNFNLNDGMASFTQLDTAAELYDLSFSYFERAQELLRMPTHRVVYENVVGDRDRELRALFDFLELDWHDAVLDHQSTAMNRGRIKTASYAQVIEPIYKRSAGRWRNFRKHLEPVIPVLRPWAEKFSYEI